jgi:hypothetical protein
MREPRPLNWSNLKLETIKFGHESRVTRTRETLPCRGTAATVNNRPVLSSERAPITADPKLSKENLKEKEKLVRAPDGGLTPGQTGRLTEGFKITFTFQLTC